MSQHLHICNISEIIFFLILIVTFPRSFYLKYNITFEIFLQSSNIAILQYYKYKVLKDF